ncbi:hypothetical protein KAFR_0E01220 [Kazachstania africana CBS 2517]|uniref:Nitrogen regulatory protein areA GATA-like domain-containing protein n=1 Tax=Kazachstania africana (strain ATCC 22294 / BCRC 22015 / CBS 2517 / CECT 1963 / NBRC 1671 / NRRL Y-8276) TaxID=1071382 RepID=H2AV76_KAZAF|nr:hypothetical protein KAFR_0E01220 [Kazachstania africana CBS 2517]CCF58276.1 hypothetical protein KAFR_0E01220 [Kazachstania africana CBS 2517]
MEKIIKLIGGIFEYFINIDKAEQQTGKNQRNKEHVTSSKISVASPVHTKSHEMSNNLASYFASSNKDSKDMEKRPPNDYDDMGPSVSMAKEAENDDEFEKSTFNLKRTRSMGLLDEYIDPTKKLIQQDNETETTPNSSSVSPPPENLLVPQDDNDVVREPERHVDYLSHHWEESEISNSWKYIILKKKKRDTDLINSSRLENASWRTWAKARSGLKTVSPEVVNWSKDSDVTWLYGPIVRDSHEMENSSNIIDNDQYGSDDENSKRRSSKKNTKVPKPILKKRTVTEILEENSLWKLNEARKHYNEMRHATSVMDPSSSVYDDYDYLAAKVNAQYFYKSKQQQKQILKSNDIQDNLASNQNEDSIKLNISPSTLLKPPIIRGSSDTTLPASIVSGLKQHLNKRNEAEMSNENDEEVPDNEVKLSSILTDPLRTKTHNTNRHIHFNDRVEQCVAIKYSKSDDALNSESDTTYQYSYNNSNDEDNESNNNYDNSEEEDYSEEEDDNNGGLFINARFTRRSDSIVHSPVTDTSSIDSSNAKHHHPHIHPIIKLLPATTLNYGSDDESDGSEFDNSYGNAVSHNVNTQRGYDYIYDYNSVYTGDTSSFFPIDSCDIIDVPEGIDLQTVIANESSNAFQENVNAYDDEPYSLSSNTDDEPYSLSSNTDDEEFIEDSRYQSSDDESNSDSNDNYDGGLQLRRTTSLGRGNNSLKDLNNSFNGAASLEILRSKTRSFITGQPLSPDVPTEGVNDKSILRSTVSSCSNSNKTFIFNSDSEDDEDEENIVPETVRFPLQPRTSNNEDDDYEDTGDELNFESLSIRNSRHRRTLQPPKRSPSSNSLSAPINYQDSSSNSIPSSTITDSNKSLRIPSNGPSLAEVSSNDVDINGYFEPRNQSIKLMVSERGFIDKSNSKSDSTQFNSSK